MTTEQLKTFLAQEMTALREKKTTIEIAKAQTGLANQVRQVIDMELKWARTISKTPNISDILKKVQHGTVAQ